jgi:predicted metal-dependent phosphoesterase TrpH
MSDGSDTPFELLEKVAAAGLKVFSVTDHDDLRANEIILAAMKEKGFSVTDCGGLRADEVVFSAMKEKGFSVTDCGGLRDNGVVLSAVEEKGFSVTDCGGLRADEIILSAVEEENFSARFITGCEISSVFEGRNLHLLCYGFDVQSARVKNMIAEGARLRRERITAMFTHLKNKHNIVISDGDRADILSKAIPGKVHIADAIMKMGAAGRTDGMMKMSGAAGKRDDMMKMNGATDKAHIADNIMKIGGAAGKTDGIMKMNGATDKAHIADVITKTGGADKRDAILETDYAAARKYIFKNYLDDMESREFKLGAEKVIEIVGKADGVVSFAHPIETQKEYGLDFAEIAETAKKLKNIGLAAIEVYHSSHGEKEVSEYAKIAAEIDLCVSGGSDYHGKNKSVSVGQLTGYGYTPEDEKITVLKLLER